MDPSKKPLKKKRLILSEATKALRAKRKKEAAKMVAPVAPPARKKKKLILSDATKARHALNKKDNLQKAIGIHAKEANKMDFFDLMGKLPQDIKRNIGGQVKDDKTAEQKEFVDIVIAHHEPLDWQKPFFLMPDGGEIMQGIESTKHGYLDNNPISGSGPTVKKEKNKASFKRKLANLYFKTTGKRMKFKSRSPIQSFTVPYLVKVVLKSGVPLTAVEDAYYDYKYFQTRTDF